MVYLQYSTRLGNAECFESRRKSLKMCQLSFYAHDRLVPTENTSSNANKAMFSDAFTQHVHPESVSVFFSFISKSFGSLDERDLKTGAIKSKPNSKSSVTPLPDIADVM